jgi:hypothetical protein
MDLNFQLYNNKSFEWALTGWVESRKSKSSLSDAAPLASTLSSLKRLWQMVGETEFTPARDRQTP